MISHMHLASGQTELAIALLKPAAASASRATGEQQLCVDSVTCRNFLVLGGAGYGNRTRLTGLGSQDITTMLSPLAACDYRGALPRVSMPVRLAASAVSPVPYSSTERQSSGIHGPTPEVSPFTVAPLRRLTWPDEPSRCVALHGPVGANYRFSCLSSPLCEDPPYVAICAARSGSCLSKMPWTCGHGLAVIRNRRGRTSRNGGVNRCKTKEEQHEAHIPLRDRVYRGGEHDGPGTAGRIADSLHDCRVSIITRSTNHAARLPAIGHEFELELDEQSGLVHVEQHRLDYREHRQHWQHGHRQHEHR
jgi:hypothetical protein